MSRSVPHCPNCLIEMEDSLSPEHCCSEDCSIQYNEYINECMNQDADYRKKYEKEF